MTAKQKIGILLAGILLVLAVLGGIVWRSVMRYVDTHTWATVAVSGGLADITEPQEQEVLKGDRISVGTAVLRITDVTTDGTVTFAVESGTLTDRAGNTVASDTLTLHHEKDYRTSGGDCTLCITSNRYQ